MIKISDELKIQIPIEADGSSTAQAKFQKSIDGMVSKMNTSNIPKIQITVSKINGSAAIAKFKKEIQDAIGGIKGNKTSVGSSKNNYWDGAFKQSVKDLTAKNVDLNSLNNYYKDLEKQGDAFHKKNLNGIDIEIKAREAQGKAFSAQIKEQMQQKEKEVKSFMSEVERLNNAKKSLNTSENYANKLGDTGLLKKISQARDNFTSFSDQIDTFSKKIGGLENLNLNLEDEELKPILDNLKKYNDMVANLQKLSTVESSLFVKDERIAKQSRDISDYALSLGKFEKANDKFKGNSGAAAEFERIKAALSDIERRSNLGETVGVDLENLKKRTNDWKASLEGAGLSGQTWFGKLQAQMQKLGVYFGASAVMMGAWRQVKEITANVIELDKVVTDLQIATGSNRQETEKLLSTYTNMGKQLGATTVDIANAADSWLRQGYSVAESNTLIKNSMMLSKLGQIDSAEATKALTSAMKGYKLSVEDSIGVVDKFTALDMEAAVSAGYIATAMAETSTGARLAGVEMDRLAGYITQVGEVTQDGAESVGVFFKTLFARMGNIKGGKLIDPETQEDISSVEVTLDNLGVKLRENGGEFRNFGTILDEVYGKWDTLGSVNQRALAVAFSGVRNQEKFLTLMDNYGQAMEYAETAANSAGTALDKYENSYLVSVEAAQNRFTAQFEALSKTILESGLITDTYDAGTGILGFFTGLIDKLGTIPALATVAAGSLSALSNKGRLGQVFVSQNRKYALLWLIGDDERVYNKNGAINKSHIATSLKWCA